MKCYIEYKIIFNSHLKIGVLLATLINVRRCKNNINSGIFSKNILELSYPIPPISFNSAILLDGSDEVSICGYLCIISLVFSLRTTSNLVGPPLFLQAKILLSSLVYHRKFYLPLLF